MALTKLGKMTFPKLGDWESLESLVESQRPILQRNLQQAIRSPFYSRRLTNNFFESPLTTKEDLRQHSPFGFLAAPRNHLATYHESSGTSGEPTSSFFTEDDWDDVVSRFLRSSVNLKTSDSVLVKTPYSMVTTAHQMHRAARRRGAMVVPADNRSTNMPYSKVVRLLKQVPITVAWCLPTEVLLWAESARLNDLDPQKHFPELRAFLVAGEPLSEPKRQHLQALWGGKKIYQDYGSTETGSLAGECREGNLHLWADRLYCEVWNEATQTLQREGRGKLVVTTLYRWAMPLVRYLIGDDVEISYGDCDCGWKLPIIKVGGRAESILEVQGRKFWPLDLEASVYSLPAVHGVHFWRARYSLEHLDIEIEAPQRRAQAAVTALESIVKERLGIDARVRPAREEIVSRHLLTEKASFQKPRFIFKANEDWSEAIHY
jgi:phenylacetate-CoA ligase